MTDTLDTDADTVVDEGAPVVDDSPEAGIEALRAQIAEAEERVRAAEKARDDERRARENETEARQEAERRAHVATTEAQTRARSAADAQYDSIVNALAASKGDLEQAKQALKTAMAEGDFDKVAELSAEIGVTAARVREFESGKTAMEERRRAGDYGGASQETTSDPREQYIRSMPPRTASWLRRNERFFTDNNFRLLVQGAANLAMGRGISPESDEYFRFIEEQAGMNPAAATSGGGPATAAAVTAPRHSPTPAAPPAGSTPSVRSSSSNTTVTLSPQELEICRAAGITPAAYAKQKIQLQNEGLMERR